MAKIKNLDKLEKQINKLEAELAVLRKGWAKEIKELSDDPTFDEYTRKGKKRLEAVAEKYDDLIVDTEEVLNGLIREYNVIVDEMNKKQEEGNE